MKRAVHVIAATILAAFGVLIFRRCLFGGQVLFWHDVSLAYMPLRDFTRQCLQEGRLPLWSSHLGCGFPVLFEGQAGALYPLHLLGYFGLSTADAYSLMCALHCILAAILAYALCRVLRMTAFAASFAGLTYGFSGFFITHVMHLPMIEAAAWLPLLLCLLQCSRQGPAWRYGIWLGLVLAAQILTGYPQIVFISLIAMTLYALCVLGVSLLSLARRGLAACSLARQRNSGGEAALAAQTAAIADSGRATSLLFAVFIMLVVGAGVGYVQWRPTMLQADFCERRAAPTPETLRDLAMTPRNLVYFIHPYALGSYASNNYLGRDHYYEVCGYVGGVALILALIGLCCSDNRVKWYFALLTVVALALSLATINPLYEVLPRVPGFNMFRGAGRNLVLSSLGIAGLAALGLDALRTNRRAQWLLAGAGAATLVLALTLGGAVRFGESHLENWCRAHVKEIGRDGLALSPAELDLKVRSKVCQFQDTFSLRDPITGLIVCGGLLALAGGLRLARGRSRFGTVALLLWLAQAAQLFVFGDPFNPVAEPSYYSSPPVSASILTASGEDCRVYTDTLTIDPDLLLAGYTGWASGDVTPYLRQRENLQPNRASLYGVSCADVQYGLVPRRQYDILEDAVQSALDRTVQPGSGERPPASPLDKTPTGDTALRLLRLLGVGYLISLPERLPEPLPELADFGFCRLYRLDGYLPRCWMVNEVITPPDSAQALRLMTSGEIDFSRQAIIEASGNAASAPAASSPGTARLSSSSDTQVIIETASEADSWLILRDAWHPLWQARVDGVQTPVYRADYILRGVFVPRGTHRVEFTFNTAPVFTWAIISLIVLIASIAALILVPRHQRR